MSYSISIHDGERYSASLVNCCRGVNQRSDSYDDYAVRIVEELAGFGIVWDTSNDLFLYNDPDELVRFQLTWSDQ